MPVNWAMLVSCPWTRSAMLATTTTAVMATNFELHINNMIEKGLLRVAMRRRRQRASPGPASSSGRLRPRRTEVRALERARQGQQNVQHHVQQLSGDAMFHCYISMI